MLRNENGIFLTMGILAFLVLSSKHILLYNEELLVALSFLAFVVFCSHYLTESIAESFQARRDAVQAEVEQSLCLREEGITALLEEHRQHMGLHTAVQNVSVFVCAEVKALGALREDTVRSVFSHQVHQKLKSLVGLTHHFHATIQQTVVSGFRSAVLEEFSRGKKVLQPKLLQQALATFKN